MSNFNLNYYREMEMRIREFEKKLKEKELESQRNEITIRDERENPLISPKSIVSRNYETTEIEKIKKIENNQISIEVVEEEQMEMEVINTDKEIQMDNIRINNH